MHYIAETRIAAPALCRTASPSRVSFRPIGSASDNDWFGWFNDKKSPSIDAISTDQYNAWNNFHGNVYRDCCVYEGDDSTGYFRRKDRAVKVNGFMLDFDCHNPTDMPIAQIGQILESPAFQSAVPCSRIVMTGNGYQVHFNYEQDVIGDGPARAEQIAKYESIIQSAMQYACATWKLNPDERCTDITRLHRHYPSNNTKRMQAFKDNANRIPVHLILSRDIATTTINDFITNICTQFPVTPAIAAPATIISRLAADPSDRMTRLLAPPCFKQLWETGSTEGNRNADRYAWLARCVSEGLNEADALQIIEEFNSRCHPPDDAATVQKHVSHFYKTPKKAGCTYMRDTCKTCAYQDKSLEEAKKECPFTKTLRADAAHPYFIGEGGNIMRIDFKSDAKGNLTEEHVPVTECGHLMVTGVIQDEEGKLYTGMLINGEWERAFELPAYIWANKTKFAEKIKGLAGEKLMCLNRNVEYMAMASEYLCPNKEIKIARDFGWNKDFTEFYAVDCIIDAKGIHEPTNQFFKCGHDSAKKLKLAIPKSDEQVIEILKHIKNDLLRFNNYDIMQYLIGLIFISPFASIFRKMASTTNAVPSIIIHGTTGSGKSAMLLLAGSFFGPIRDSDLISFASTPRVVNDLGHWFKDCLYIVDDLKWSSIHPATQTQVVQILQAYIDGHGRNRLSNRGTGGDWEPSQGKEIRGTVCISAEDLPTGEASIFGRFMIVHLDSHTIDTGLYERCLAQSKHYNVVMAAYIAWYLASANSQADLLSKFDSYRRKIEQGVPKERVNIVRVCSQLALCLVGYHMFLAFCMKMGVLGQAEAEKLLAEHEMRVMTLRDQRLSQITGETPVEKFLQMISSLLQSGRVRLDDGSAADKDHRPIIGFEERDDVMKKDILYLDPQISFGQVQRAYDDLKERIPFGQHSLGQQLHSQGYLARKDADRMTASKRHNGRLGRYYAIDLSKFDFKWQPDSELNMDAPPMSSAAIISAEPNPDPDPMWPSDDEPKQPSTLTI
jgi:hypothetical protein